MSARRFRVTGRVQGVGFRAWAVRTARALGVNGWVRNRLDGSVELLAEGDPAAIDILETACRRGPDAARVDAVTAEPALGIVAERFEEKPTV